MAHNYIIRKRPVQVSFFDSTERLFEIVCNEVDLFALHRTLRQVLSKRWQNEPLSAQEEDVLSDLYNSISLINFSNLPMYERYV